MTVASPDQLVEVSRIKAPIIKEKKKKSDLKAKQLQEIKGLLEWDTMCLMHETLMDGCPELRCSKMDRNLFDAVRNKAIHCLGDEGFFKLDSTNYNEPLHTLLRAEELYESIQMRRHDIFNRKVKAIIRDRNKPSDVLLQVNLPGLTKGQPNLIPSDLVVLEYLRTYQVCEIKEIEGEIIRFKQPKKFKFSNPLQYRFNISFERSGISYMRYHDALEQICHTHTSMLFEYSQPWLNNEPYKNKFKIDVSKTNALISKERLLNCNDRQRLAIQGILEAKCRPKPYILFGPPGTGKTTTLVEAVAQIYRRAPGFRILVCANSNNCADQLANAIYATGLVDSLRRLCSKRHFDMMPMRSFYHTIDREKLAKFRIIVTTNNLAAALAKGPKFDYVFVDEAGHGHEPEILIPANRLKPGGCLVLAGDPKQLGPVIHSSQVERLGLGQSMLERLFKFRVYSRDSSGHYDKSYITKLVNCYRCDPRILHLCNKLFYHDELVCFGKTPASLLKKLNIRHPLTFHRIRGHEEKITSSTSRCNPKEADLCVEYVIELYKIGIDPDKIGIISFYSLQKELIIDKLKSRLNSELSKINLALKQLSMTSGDLDYLNNQTALKGQSRKNSSNDSIKKIADLANSFSNMTIVASKGAKNKSRVYRRRNKSKVSVSNIPLRSDWLCKVDTVDAFQGKEKEIIILSTVRCPNQSGSIDQCGFLADSKRFNVAISRAKWLVVAVGHPAVLNCHPNWRQFKAHAALYE